MSRSEDDRFADIVDAIQRCQDYVPHLRSADLGSMAYDAVLRNLAVIGEAVWSLPTENRSWVATVRPTRLVGFPRS